VLVEKRHRGAADEPKAVTADPPLRSGWQKRSVECCGIPLKPAEGLTPIFCHAALERSACAPFIKERRMECINATSLRRKSGQWGTQPSLPAKKAGHHECAPNSVKRSLGRNAVTHTAGTQRRS
jgi:hypothetical protein